MPESKAAGMQTRTDELEMLIRDAIHKWSKKMVDLGIQQDNALYLTKLAQDLITWYTEHTLIQLNFHSK